EGKFTSLHVSHGLLWIVLTMVTFAIMILMTRFLSQRVAPMTLTLYSNMIAFVASVPFVFIIDQPIQLGTTSFDWGFLIITGITVHGIATLLWNHNIQYVDASRASILSNLEPFVAMIMGVILLSQVI